MIWQLFVDETGSFAQHSVVGLVGVLIRAYDSPQLKQTLRRRIEQAFPLVEYPPHATVLNLPVSRAVYAWPPLPSPLPPDAVETVTMTAASIALLQASNDAPALDLRNRVRARPVEFAGLRPANRWLASKSPPAFALLEKLANAQGSDFSCALADTLGKLGPSDRDGAFAGAVVSTARGAGPGPRYEQMLRALFGTIATALPKGSQVWTRVARPTFGEWSLSTAALRGVASRAKTEHVEFVDHPPVGYNEDAHPGLVLADFAANRFGQVLRSRPRSVDALVRGFERRVALTLKGPTSAGGGSTLCSLGERTDEAPWVVEQQPQQGGLA